VDLIVIKILAIVGTKYGENPYGRKGKGFLAMYFSQELVDPNLARN